MSSPFNKFDATMLAIASKKHNLAADSIKVALTSVAPVAANALLGDLTEISYTHLSARAVTTTSFTQTSGVAKLVLADLTITASGGSAASFRYAVLYNDTASNDELLGWYDRGVATVLADGDSLVLDFDGSGGAITFE